VLAFGLALLSKPSSAAVPFLILALSGLSLGRGWKRAGLDAWPYFALLLPLAILTKAIQPDSGLGWVPPPYLRPFVAMDALAFSLRRLVLPLGWTLDYGRTPELVLGNWQAYAIWIVPAGLAAWIWRGPRWLAAPLALFGLGLLPVSGLVPFDFQRFSTVADRYLYLPMLGPSLGLALGLARTRARPEGRTPLPPWAGTAARLAAAALLACLGVLAAQGREAWRDNLSLYTRSLAANPVSPGLHLNLGAELANRARYGDSAAHLREALRQYAAFSSTYGRKGAALAEAGRQQEAEAWFSLASRVSKDVAAARLNLGVVAMATGHADEAAAQFGEALRLWPGLSAAHVGLGNVLAGQSRLAEAIGHYEDALRLRPGLPEALAGLQAARTALAARSAASASPAGPPRPEAGSVSPPPGPSPP
jgi:Flp pilus assembly protein TadD